MRIHMQFFLAWMLIILSNLLVIIDVNLAASAQCLSEQKDLLLQLRNNLTYETSLSTKLANWDERTDCCRWRGVGCDDAGQVTGLDLRNESIFGGQFDSSSSLFRLGFLRTLSLAGNSFDSMQLPMGFGLLNELVSLNLSESGLAGTIPSDFSRMSRLVTLDLSSSSHPYMLLLKLENPNQEMFLQNLTRLRELRLDGVNIAATNGIDWWRLLSSSLRDLQVLSLSKCNLSGPLDSSLAKLESLSVIHLDENRFSAPFPDFFTEFPNLTVLSCRSCSLLGEVPKQLFLLSTLRTIDFSSNEELGGSLPEFPQNGVQLENLDLSYTNFSGNLPQSIGNLRMLSILLLFDCSFSGPIPSSISNLSQLLSIDFSLNHFNGTLPSFSLCRNLTSIVLRNNNINGQIPSQWEGLKNLIRLDLSQNSLLGKLPAFLFTLPSLESLIIPNNKFSGQISELGHVSLSPLILLDLSGNNFDGSIPQFLFKFHSLSGLSIASNKFTGTVELAKFVELKNLSDLDLSYNKLSVGTNGNDSTFSLLPQFNSLMLASCKLQKFPFLKNQSRLNMLDLSENQIAGEIPNWIWEVNNGFLRFLNLSHNQFTHLQQPYRFQSHHYLDLHSNQLTEAIPLPPRSAVYVDFSDNRFNSSIPADIGNHLLCAIFFKIANSSIIGSIPLSLCNASRLEVLDLSDNSLSSSIPSCLMENSTTLVALNLHGNKLSGNISNTFTNNCRLETLDLSLNLLEGLIPKSLLNCTKLKVLNLGHNMISSTFPCTLKKLPELRVLVLHFNRIHGQISCTEINHSWPNLRVIDIASNNLSGLLAPKFLSSLAAMMAFDENPNSELNYLHYQSSAFKVYYQDTVTMNYKGNPTMLQKVLSILTYIDLSSNNFHGSMPPTVGELRSVHLLNLSNNDLTGQIPPSVGNLKELEALDLSFNKLTGEIPGKLASLTFLSFLNLSHNQLVGMIPAGRQIQTFPESSFEGNDGLCGFPLNRTCNSPTIPALHPQPAADDHEDRLLYPTTEIYVTAAIGFFVGLGVIFVPLWLSKRWRICYNKHIDQFMLRIFCQEDKRSERQYILKS